MVNGIIFDKNVLDQKEEGDDPELKTLGTRFKLGILTRGDSEKVWASKSVDDIRPYFKAAAGYSETDHHPPYPDPFYLIAQKMHVFPENCVYVGADENSIQTAKFARMKTIRWTNVRETPTNADAIVTSFYQLVPVIEGFDAEIFPSGPPPRLSGDHPV